MREKLENIEKRIRMELAGKIKAGDRVCYARGFLKSIGAYTGELPFAKGTVSRVEVINLSTNFVLAYVKWDNESDAPGRVLLWNLVRVEDVNKEDR